MLVWGTNKVLPSVAASPLSRGGCLILFLAGFLFAGFAATAMDNAGGQEVISIVVDNQALGPELPSEERLIAVGKELLQKHFSKDVSLSIKAKGQITLVNREKAQYELMALFLYRETYTAVNHRIVFTLSGDTNTVLSIE
jgi:hypothetical protein